MLKTYYVPANLAGGENRAENETDGAVALVVLTFLRIQTGGNHFPSPSDKHCYETNRRAWGLKRELFWIRWS